MDMLMMVLTSGRERTESEFRSLLQEAGFSMVQVIRAAGVSIIDVGAHQKPRFFDHAPVGWGVIG